MAPKYGFSLNDVEDVYLKIALQGTAGSGKTMGSLLLAFGMADEIEKRTGQQHKIAVIDSENGSASFYRHKFEHYDRLNLKSPFTVESYVEAIRWCEDEGYSIVIVDSMTHEWKQILAEKEALDNRGGNQNQFANWGPPKKKHEQFKSALLDSKIHVIGTMRSKSEYSQTKNDKGQTTVKKLGMAPIAENDFEYEFTLVLEIGRDKYASPQKDRTDIWKDQSHMITRRDGAALIKWLYDDQKSESKPVDPKDRLRAKSLQALLEIQGFPYKAEQKAELASYVSILTGQITPFSSIDVISADNFDHAFVEFNGRLTGKTNFFGALEVAGIDPKGGKALEIVNEITGMEFAGLRDVSAKFWDQALEELDEFITAGALPSEESLSESGNAVPV